MYRHLRSNNEWYEDTRQDGIILFLIARVRKAFHLHNHLWQMVTYNAETERGLSNKYSTARYCRDAARNLVSRECQAL